MLLLSVLFLPNRKGETLFLQNMRIMLTIRLADVLWTAKCEAFSSVCCLYCERGAIILSPAGGKSKFQLCTVLSNLLSVLLIIFLLASTLQREENNSICTAKTLCFHEVALG